MTVSVNSLLGTQRDAVREVLNKALEFMLPRLDPFWRDNVVTSQGVGSVDDIGRDYKILKTYHGSMAGVVENAGGRADFVLYGDPLNQSISAKQFLQGVGFSTSANSFPDALNGPNAKPFRMGIPMRAMLGNLAMTLSESAVDALPATMREIVGPKMTGHARKWAHTLCNYWYLSQNNYYKLCGLDSTLGLSVESNGGFSVLRFQPDNYAVDRFAIGQNIQFYNSTGTTLRTTPTGASQFIVCRVDPLENIVEAIALDGQTPGTVGTNILTTDIVVFANSKGTSATPFSANARFTGIAGINSYMKYGDSSSNADSAANCILGDERDTANSINVQQHSEFKSFNRNMGGEPLTENTLRKILRRFHAAKDPIGQNIDCLVASDGVWLAYEATRIGREEVDRTGRLSSVKNQGSATDKNFAGFEFSMDGRTYTGYTSTFVEAGTVYGHKKSGGNWKRYVPPGPKGTKRMDQAEFAPIDFVAPALTGTSSNQIPIFKIENGRNVLTEFTQIPTMLRMQLVPDQVAGLRLTNCGEERIYSTGSTT